MNDNWKKNYSRYKDLFLNMIHSYYAKPNIKIYLELILSLSTVICFSLFAIKPTILTIIQLNKEIKAKEETIAKIEQKLNDLQLAENILLNEGPRLEMLNEAIPDSTKLETLIERINSIASTSNIEMSGISISEIILYGKSQKRMRLSDNVKELPQGAGGLSFTVSLSGEYQNLFNFLTVMENSRRPFKIDNVNITSIKLDTGRSIRLTLIGRLPYLEIESNENEKQ